MSTDLTIGAPEEVPVFFPAGDETLFGILTKPSGPDVGSAVLILPGGAGTRLSSNRNRWSVRLARRLAALGYHALRFDYRGAGESTGAQEALRLDAPYTDDVEGAVRWLRAQGISTFVLVGSCFGARTALSYAGEMEDVRAVALVSPPIRDYSEGERTSSRLASELTLGGYLRRAASGRFLKGLKDPRLRRGYIKVARAKWRTMRRPASEQETGAEGVSTNFLGPLTSFLDRGGSVLFVYGEEEESGREFRIATEGSLGRVLERYGPQVEIQTLPGAVHGFTTVASQDGTLEEIEAWLARLTERADQAS